MEKIRANFFIYKSPVMVGRETLTQWIIAVTLLIDVEKH
jgi:hypothetical protein